MYNQVIFYNHFGAGDIFESREFVLGWMGFVKSNKYFYSHGKNPSILKDLPSLEFKDITHHMNPMKSVFDDSNGNLYVNTWIGRNSSYVLPGIGCTVEKLLQMHNDMLAINGMGILKGDVIEYIPNIDYSACSIDEVNLFMDRHKEEKIFIDNGVVQSNQAENFPFSGIIHKLALNNPNKCFIVSHQLSDEFRADNVYSTSDIIKSEGWGFDLNELSYVSTFCSTLIGRNSGPHVYTQVRDNVMDGSKKLLSFTYQQQGSSFVVNTNVKIRKYWSDVTNEMDVYKKIEEVLHE